MPLPIQVGSVTQKLREFFRIRGRSKFMLDETVVPVVQLQDLSKGSFQAGITPTAWTQSQVGAAGRQFVITLNPDAVLPLVADLTTDIRFIGRSFSMTHLTLVNRTVNNARVRVGIVPRGTVIVPTGAGAAKQAIAVQIRELRTALPGVMLVPVVLATVPAIPFVIFPAANEFYRGDLGANSELVIPTDNPATTIDLSAAIVIEELLGVGGGTWDVNVRGNYQEQPN